MVVNLSATKFHQGPIAVECRAIRTAKLIKPI
jgi:hypothetical protein